MRRRLTFDSAKYGRSPRPLYIHIIDPQPRNRPSFVTESPIDHQNEDSDHHFIIPFGNGSAPNLRGKLPSPSKNTSCNTVWNRDVMAAKDIRFIIIYIALNNNERPDPSKRPRTNGDDGTGPGEARLPTGETLSRDS